MQKPSLRIATALLAFIGVSSVAAIAECVSEIGMCHRWFSPRVGGVLHVIAIILLVAAVLAFAIVLLGIVLGLGEDVRSVPHVGAKQRHDR